MNDLNLIVHGDSVRQIKVRATDPVSTILSKQDLTSSGLIIHNSIVIHPSFTFSYYDIKDGDHVHVVKSTNYSISKTKHDWLNYLSQSIRQKNQFEEMESLHRENLRIKDMFSKRIEGNEKAFTKILNKFSRSIQNDDSKQNINPFSKGSLSMQALTPSKEALVVDWQM